MLLCVFLERWDYGNNRERDRYETVVEARIKGRGGIETHDMEYNGPGMIEPELRSEMETGDTL
ncbi:hypothetical protein Tco_0306983, partial [Tanacetum coccineum]